jgi:hypothetical protein
VVHPGQMYDLPKGQVGKRFIYTLSKILDGIQARQRNSERFLVYCMVVLQRGGHYYQDIKGNKEHDYMAFGRMGQRRVFHACANMQ